MKTESPCVDVCEMDPDSGLCRGCFRTIHEIAAWSRMTGDEKDKVWPLLKERRDFVERRP